MIDLELYKIFKIVAEEENITKASKKMNISQPAVTKHIQNLERALNNKLFERTNKGLNLTQTGRKVYEEIKDSIIKLESIYRKYSGNKEINLGTHATMLSKMISKKLSKYYKENENVKINIDTSDLKELLMKLEKQELDLVITKKLDNFKNENVKFIELGVLQDILVVNKNSDLIGKKIDLKILKEEIFYMPGKNSSSIINFFNSTNCNESEFKSIKIISYNPMIEIIKNANGIGLATREYIKNELEDKNIVELKTDFSIKPIKWGIYINKNNSFKELIDLIELLQKSSDNF